MSSLAADLEAAARIGADEQGASAASPGRRSSPRPTSGSWSGSTSWGSRSELDQAGNVIGRWQAAEGKAVLLGSHLDTVPRGGRYDGALGVLAALDVVRRLQAEGVEPAGRCGSSPSTTRRARASRPGCWEAARSAATRPRRLGAPRGRRGDGRGWLRRSSGCPRRGGSGEIGAYLELHIEQGPVLEQAGVDLGLVTAITGMLGFRARFLGEANHAGTTPMVLRRDALAGAARAVLALRERGARRATT